MDLISTHLHFCSLFLDYNFLHYLHYIVSLELSGQYSSMECFPKSGSMLVQDMQLYVDSSVPRLQVRHVKGPPEVPSKESL